MIWLSLFQMATRCRGFSMINLSSPVRASVSSSVSRHLLTLDMFLHRNNAFNTSLFMDLDSSEKDEKSKDNDLIYRPNKYPPSIPFSGQRRSFSVGNNDSWIVPKKFPIPEDKIEFSFVRSSGAGGQNVNKVNTQACLKFHVMDADWIPLEVRERIVQNEGNRINKEGFLSISSQEYRTQSQNRKDALDKLEQIILNNYARPKIRKMRKGISKASKAINLENKRKLSEKKKNRKNIDF